MATKPSSYPQNSRVWDLFFEISQIPRASGKEEKIQKYLIDFAKKHSFDCVKDEIGNILIKIPPSKGKEKSPTIMVQNHMDMVCDKIPELEFNFDTDSIPLLVKDAFLQTKGTTLGADNGIGCALSLSLSLEKDFSHPPLELLFTVDEERGLTGAAHFDGRISSAKYLINLDTEEWGTIYVGCAGGIDYDLKGTYKKAKKTPFFKTFDIKIRGLIGGHSGFDIHRSRGSAIHIASELLFVFKKALSYELLSFKGGKAHNIISRDADICIAIDPADETKLLSLVLEKRESFLRRLPKDDQNLKIEVEASKNADDRDVLDSKHLDQVLSFLLNFPSGAFKYMWEFREPLVSLSNNLAQVKIENGGFFVQSFMRFMNEEDIIGFESKLFSLAKTLDLEIHKGRPSLSWTPKFEGELLDKAKLIFKEFMGKDAEVKAIHAGIECGILLEKLKNAPEAISIGPEVLNAHAPHEKVRIESVDLCWNFLRRLISAI